jgi:tetratricopeptide (TPR) repeat protein
MLAFSVFIAATFGLAPVVPDGAPSQFRTVDGGVAELASVDDAVMCGGCHRDIAAQWRTSAHAFASFNNPLYRVSIDVVRQDKGPEASRACASCHDVALLGDGGIERREIFPDDRRAHAGISCVTCHSAQHARVDGNGSLSLRTDAAFPRTGENSSLEAHRRRVANAPLRTAELCAACHRSFLDESTGNAAAFPGMDDYGAWLRSAWSGSHAERPDEPLVAADCRGCHMRAEPAVLGDVAAKNGMVPSHRFLGGHTHLAAMRHDADQLAQTRKFLMNTIEMSVAAVRVESGRWQSTIDSARAFKGQASNPVRLEADVVLFNRGVGHRFPGGVLDNQGTQVETTLLTAANRVVARAAPHELRAEVVDAEGQPVTSRETHRFLAAVWNFTLPTREARVFRVRFEVPAGLSEEDFPLRLTSSVVHRSRIESLSAAACLDARSERGQAFARASREYVGLALDACVEPPRTVIAETSQVLDGLAAAEWEWAFRRGLGLSIGLQEYLDEAQEALELAQRLVPRERRQERGRVHWALGMVAAKRGQLSQALAQLERAEALLGRNSSPSSLAAVHRVRGDAYAQVWRWPDAAREYSKAARLAPSDLVVWQSLAMARASAGSWREALNAAQRGLRLQPRDGDCLRVQALALERLEAPVTSTEAALTAALHWRIPDAAPAAKAACSRTVPGCAARRNPVPVYDAVGEGP